jgi:hypothetical protein
MAKYGAVFTCSMVLVLLACGPVPVHSQAGGNLVVEPALPLEVPEGAEPFQVSGTIVNGNRLVAAVLG